MIQGAQMRPMPRNNGKSAYFTGYRPMTRPTTALTEGTGATAVGVGARQITATIEEWGATMKFSSLFEATKIDPGVVEQLTILGDNRGRTLDYQLTKEVARNGIWAVPTAYYTTNVQTVTVSAVSATNTTSVFVTTAATSLNAVSATSWVGAVATVVRDSKVAVDGIGYITIKYGYAGRVSTITHSVGAGDTVTLNTTAPNAAAPEKFQSNDRVRLVALSNGGSTVGLISNTHFAMAQRDLIGNDATMFGDGTALAVVPSAVLYSLKLDPTWVNASSYSSIKQLYRGEAGMWYGSRIVESTQPYRETVAGVEDEAAGAVWFSFFMGQNSFGHTELEGGGNGLYIVRGPDTNEPIPRNVYLSWAQNFANKAITAPHCVAVVSAAAS
jgi:hypothetical protein